MNHEPLFHYSCSRARELTEVVGHIRDCTCEISLRASYRPSFPEVHAVSTSQLEFRDVGCIVSGCRNNNINLMHLAILGDDTFRSDFSDGCSDNLDIILLKCLKVAFSRSDAGFS